MNIEEKIHKAELIRLINNLNETDIIFMRQLITIIRHHEKRTGKR